MVAFRAGARQPGFAVRVAGGSLLFSATAHCDTLRKRIQVNLVHRLTLTKFLGFTVCYRTLVRQVGIESGTGRRMMNEKSSKATVKLHGTVQRVIESPFAHEPEKAEIEIDGPDPLYREIRIANTLENNDGEKVALKSGADVEVRVEAPEAAIIEIDSAGK
jgi:hypothetical protein